MQPSHSRAVVVMILVAFLWSTAGVVTRHLEEAKSFEVTFWRSFATVLSLLVILPALKGRTVFAGMLDGSKTFWASGLCWCCMFTFYMLAITLTSVANVLVTLAIGPLVTALFARIFLGQRLPFYTWVAIVAAGCGIAWMFGSQLLGASTSDNTVLGILVALVVPITGGANWTLVQRAQSKGMDLDLMPAVLVGAALSSLIMLPLAWPLKATAHDVFLLGGLGLYQLAIPCTLAVWCARVLKAPEVSLLALLEVPFGIVLVWLGANEAPDSAVLSGGALVIAALALNEFIGWRKRA